MRCKNCGSENEEGRYICQNCGSPLYDEDNEIIESGGYLEAYEYEDDDYDKEYEKKATKKSIIIIVILAVILIAVIAGVAFAASHFGAGKTPETSESNTIGASDDYFEPSGSYSFDNTTEQTTEATTEATTEKTTESTTKTTTTTNPISTKPAESKYKVYVDIDGNGNILGEGEYSKGKKVTLVATPDAGAQFVGWYENGVIVASGTKYSFTVESERRLTALFQAIPEEVTENVPSENE